MNGQLEVLITFLLYIAFFGWVGYLRGTLSEGIVFAVALLSWLVLQEEGDIFVRLVNLGSKGVAFVQAGGLGENPDQAFGAIGSAPPWVTAESRGGFLFLLWAFLLFLAYIVSSPRVLGKKSRSDGWAIILGILNGLLYATILLPRLVILLQPADVADAAADGAAGSISGFLDVLGGGFELLRSSISGLWDIFAPAQQSLILLILLTLFLLLAANSLRGGTKKA
jgi:hypothetical protein